MEKKKIEVRDWLYHGHIDVPFLELCNVADKVMHVKEYMMHIKSNIGPHKMLSAPKRLDTKLDH